MASRQQGYIIGEAEKQNSFCKEIAMLKSVADMLTKTYTFP